MSNRAEAHYFVVRYMFDELRDEASNVGLILLQANPQRVITRFLDDFSAKSRVDARINRRVVADFQDWLERTSERLQVEGAPFPEAAKGFEQALQEHTGNVIRIMGPRSVLLTEADAEMQTLFDEWVAPRRKAKPDEEAAMRDPLGGLRRAAQSEISRVLHENITTPAVRRAIKRDVEIRGRVARNRFDVALLPLRKAPVRLFHHVLVLPEPEESYDQAAALARRWIDVREANGADRLLTAVFYSRENVPNPVLPDAAALLRHDEIQVASVSDLRMVATKLDHQVQLFEPDALIRRRPRKTPKSRR